MEAFHCNFGLFIPTASQVLGWAPQDGSWAVPGPPEPQSGAGGKHPLPSGPVCHTNAMLLFIGVDFITFHPLCLWSPKSSHDPGPLESKDAFLLVSCLGFPIPFCLFPSPGFSGSPLRRQVYTGWSFGVTTMWPVFWKGRVRWPSSQGGRLGGVMMRCGLCCISLVFGRDEAFWFQENCGSGHAMTY